MLAARLHEAVATVCPIVGVSVRVPGTADIVFAPEATGQQRADAESVITNFDWSDTAHAAWQEDRKPERKTLRQAASQAIGDIDSYLAIASPTNAQVVAQVRRLSVITKHVIRRLVQLD